MGVIGDIIQPTHLLFILVVALLVLGPKRLPEVGRSLGKGIRDFRGAMAGIEEHVTMPPMPDATPPTPPVAATAMTAPPTLEPLEVAPAYADTEPASAEPAELAAEIGLPSSAASVGITELAQSRTSDRAVATEPAPYDYAD